MSVPAFTRAQLTAYLSRVGLSPTGNFAPDLSTLRRFQSAQLQAVPYENLSVHWRPEAAVRDSLPPCGLSPDQVYEKMVLKPRGGYCLEVNMLLAYALRAVGFTVDLCTGKWLVDLTIPSTGGEMDAEDGKELETLANPDVDSIWATHVLLVVCSPTSPDDRYLVDIGMAKNSLTSPMALRDGERGSGIAGKQARLRKLETAASSRSSWVLQFRLTSSHPWISAMHFSDVTAEQATVDHIHTWMSRAPESITPDVPFATMVVPGVGQVSLQGTKLKIRPCGEDPAVVGDTQVTSEEVEDVDGAFAKYFGIKGYKEGCKLVKVGETPPAW
ncbi:N-terminal acetyltransferase [Thoreauomyces humboldtii]|nr:N-terminal acetyltransferase [Thoreauomyces humboldtii]